METLIILRQSWCVFQWCFMKNLNNFKLCSILLYIQIWNTMRVCTRLCKLQKGCTWLASASDKVYQLLAHGRLLRQSWCVFQWCFMKNLNNFKLCSIWYECYVGFHILIWFDLLSRHFQQYFSYIMATSFSGGRSRSIRREPMEHNLKLFKFFIKHHWKTHQLCRSMIKVSIMPFKNVLKI
jgi:hypothetical protein